MVEDDRFETQFLGHQLDFTCLSLSYEERGIR